MWLPSASFFSAPCSTCPPPKGPGAPPRTPCIAARARHYALCCRPPCICIFSAHVCGVRARQDRAIDHWRAACLGVCACCRERVAQLCCVQFCMKRLTHHRPRQGVRALLKSFKRFTGAAERCSTADGYAPEVCKADSPAHCKDRHHYDLQSTRSRRRHSSCERGGSSPVLPGGRPISRPTRVRRQRVASSARTAQYIGAMPLPAQTSRRRAFQVAVTTLTAAVQHFDFWPTFIHRRFIIQRGHDHSQRTHITE